MHLLVSRRIAACQQATEGFALSRHADRKPNQYIECAPLTTDHTRVKVVHLVGQGSLADDDEVPFRVVSGGGSDLARISCSLRHDTAYKPHEVSSYGLA